MARPVYETDDNQIRDIQMVAPANPATADAFGRQRIAPPFTLFDSKAISANVNLFYDDVEASGSGTGSSYSENRASYTLSVSDTTAGKRVRQTRQRFNYQPGKSQLILMTGVFGNAGTGITKRIGYFDESNGLGLKIDADGPAFFIRSNVTGTPVDTEIPLSDWDTGRIFRAREVDSVDFTKSQIFFIDFEWLGVGSVRFGFVIDGYMFICHQENNANNLASVYMSTPNLPLRHEIENDGTGAADTLEAICSSVMSEGGQEETGITRYVSTNGTHVDANAADTTYAVVGIRLKSTELGQVVKLAGISMFSETNDDFEWLVILNPTVADTFTYSDLAGSAIQYATGSAANTVTGGTALAGGWSASSSAVSEIVDSLYYMGSQVDGTQDEVVLCVRPLATQADIQGSITIKESF